MSEEKTQEQEFLKMLITSMVNEPDKVCIKRTVDDRGVLYVITVDDSDIAKIIGKGGSIAQAIRLLLKVVGYKHNVKASMKIDVPHPTQDNN